METGYCRGCNGFFPIGTLGRESIVKGLPGWCANIGKTATQVIFPSTYWKR